MVSLDLSTWTESDLFKVYEQIKEYHNGIIKFDTLLREYWRQFDKNFEDNYRFMTIERNIYEELAKRYYEKNKPITISMDEFWDRLLKKCDTLLYKMEHGNTQEALDASAESRRIRRILEPILQKKGIKP